MVIRKCRVVDASQLAETSKVTVIKMTILRMSRTPPSPEQLMRQDLYFELKLNPHLLNFNYYISNSSILFHFIKIVVYILFVFF